MKDIEQSKAPDYVVIGHITEDITAQGKIAGGTALYAAGTAHAMGKRVGVVTSYHPDFKPPLPPNVAVLNHNSAHTTTFKNIETNKGRVQYISQKANDLTLACLPARWQVSPILHFGPVAGEFAGSISPGKSNALICITLQGWLRSWGKDGKVNFGPRANIEDIIEKADLAVLSIEDVRNDESLIEDFASSIKVLAVTESENGARIYWNGDMRRFFAPKTVAVDATGAGDIFAAVFFIRYAQTQNPWEAARLANQLAAISVSRRGMNSIPRTNEIKTHSMEIFSS